MRVLRVVMLTREHAVLHLRPSWLARLFGAPDLVVELEHANDSRVSKYTRTALGYMNYGGIIRAAMEGYPLESAPLPATRVVKE